MANEKRLIDAEPIKKFIVDGLNNTDLKKAFGHDAIEILTEIEFAHTVEAVEVVRCSECKHWDEIEDTCGGGYCNHRCWFVLDAEPPIVNHSDFCSYGERRTDNERKAD